MWLYLCGKVDSQIHIMWCPSYELLREGRDIDNDLDVIMKMERIEFIIC